MEEPEYAVILVAGGAFFLTSEPSEQQKEVAEIAQCIKDSGAIFYGAFWCPHCAEQKKILGSRKFNYNYVECSTIDRKGLTQVCKDENITNYPTWKFADEETCTGSYSLAALASKSSCPLPKEISELDARGYIEYIIEERLPVDATDEQKDQYRGEFIKLLEAPAIKERGLTIDTATAKDIIDIELSLRCQKEVPPISVDDIQVEAEGVEVKVQDSEESI